MRYKFLAEKAVDTVGQNAESIGQGIDKVARKVEERTGAQHSAKITKAADQAKGLVGKAEERTRRGGGSGPGRRPLPPDDRRP